MTVDYDPSQGIIVTALRIKSTVVGLVLEKSEFYLLLVVHLCISASYKLDYFQPEEFHLDLSMHLTGITGSLMTFFVVFYNGNVFARYNKLYELTKNMNEYCLYAVSIISREVPCKHLQRKLSRMLLASAFLFFFERTESGNDGNISQAEWEQLMNLGLISDREADLLKAHCKTSGGRAAMPSFMLLQWFMILYRTKCARLNELEKVCWGVRRCQDDVVEMMELPMPFQYFHIMNMMMMLNLSLWSYSLALEDSYFASLIFVFVQLVFQGIRELSVALADPYGDDDADFPLDEWMTQLYIRLNEIIEDPYDPTVHSGHGELPPLRTIAKGKMVIDLLVDQSTTNQRINVAVAQSADTDAAARSSLNVPVPHCKQFSPKGDNKGTYQPLPQKEEEEDEEEEDDDDD